MIVPHTLIQKDDVPVGDRINAATEGELVS